MGSTVTQCQALVADPQAFLPWQMGRLAPSAEHPTFVGAASPPRVPTVTPGAQGLG